MSQYTDLINRKYTNTIIFTRTKEMRPNYLHSSAQL